MTLATVRLDTIEVAAVLEAVNETYSSDFISDRTIRLEGNTLVLPKLGLTRDTLLWHLEDGPKHSVRSFRTAERIRRSIGMNARI